MVFQDFMLLFYIVFPDLWKIIDHETTSHPEGQYKKELRLFTEKMGKTYVLAYVILNIYFLY